MGKFRQISTELLPLIYVENWFLCPILGIFGRFSSNFVYKLILGRSDSGSQMGKFCQISTQSYCPLFMLKISFDALS